MNRFGGLVDPEAKARYDAQLRLRQEFFAGLNEVGKKISSQLTFEGTEGDRGFGVALKSISSNYPWVYIDFGYSGSLSFELLNDAQTLVKDYCSLKDASYLTAHISKTGIRFRLIYREDLAWKKLQADQEADKKKAPVEKQGLPCGCHCKGGCGSQYEACMYPCAEHIPF